MHAPRGSGAPRGLPPGRGTFRLRGAEAAAGLAARRERDAVRAAEWQGRLAGRRAELVARLRLLQRMAVVGAGLEGRRAIVRSGPPRWVAARNERLVFVVDGPVDIPIFE